MRCLRQRTTDNTASYRNRVHSHNKQSGANAANGLSSTETLGIKIWNSLDIH